MGVGAIVVCRLNSKRLPAKASFPDVDYVYTDDVYSCVKNAVAVVIMTNWLEYEQLNWNRIESQANGDAVVIDSWRKIKAHGFGKLDYIALGLGN